MNKNIETLKLQDLPSISQHMKYFDGELYFADNVESFPITAPVFRIDFLVLLFCLDGEMTLRVNEKSYTLHQHDALFVNSNSLVSIDEISNEFSCKLCALNSQMVFSLVNRGLVDAIIDLEENPVIPFTPQESELMVKYYELAIYKMTNEGFNCRESVLSILKALSIDILSFINRHNGNEDILRQADKLFRSFLFIITNKAEGHRSVKSYADELCVSPKYLTSVCRQHSGKSASEIITNSLVSRIKQMLLYSDLSVKEIANMLNFDNLSFFGKFVKKHLGHSPVNYRKINNYGN